MRIKIKTVGRDSAEVANSHLNIGGILQKMGLFDEARFNLESALVISRRINGEAHPRVGTALCALCSLLMEQEQYAEALKLLKKALKIRRKTLGGDHADVCLTILVVADTYRCQEKFAEAAEVYDEAFELVTDTIHRSLGPKHMSVCHYWNAVCKQKTGDVDDALKEAARAFIGFMRTDREWAIKAQALVRELRSP